MRSKSPTLSMVQVPFGARLNPPVSDWLEKPLIKRVQVVTALSETLSVTRVVPSLATENDGSMLGSAATWARQSITSRSRRSPTVWICASVYCSRANAVQPTLPAHSAIVAIRRSRRHIVVFLWLGRCESIGRSIGHLFGAGHFGVGTARLIKLRRCVTTLWSSSCA